MAKNKQFEKDLLAVMNKGYQTPEDITRALYKRTRRVYKVSTVERKLRRLCERDLVKCIWKKTEDARYKVWAKVRGK